MNDQLCTWDDGLFFPGSPQSFTLKAAQIPIHPGHWIALLGGSGMGKTTLLRFIAGTLSPNHMCAHFRTTHPLPPTTLRLFLSAHPPLMPWLSCARNITLYDGIHKNPPCALTLQRILHILQLSHAHDARPHTLSSGMAQRIALGQIFYTALRMRSQRPHTPITLCLDEPFSHLDNTLKMDIMHTLKKLSHDFALSFIFITHDGGERDAAHESYALIPHPGDVRSLSHDAHATPAYSAHAHLLYKGGL